MPKRPTERDENAPLSDYERYLLRKLFRSSAEIPQEFWASLRSKQEIDPPNILVSDIPGLKGEELRAVGATGQPQFQNSWVNYDGAAPTGRYAAFWKDVLGVVHLSGVVKSGTISTNIFTLPEGYWPLYDQTFCVLSNGALGTVSIGATGNVVPTGSNVFLFLDGITFRAA